MFVCERGTMFGYSDLVVDPRNLVWMRDAGCPVTADVTHALQQPVRRSHVSGAESAYDVTQTIIEGAVENMLLISLRGHGVKRCSADPHTVIAPLCIRTEARLDATCTTSLRRGVILPVAVWPAAACGS